MQDDDQYDLEFEVFKKDVKNIIGVDLNQYKPSQMKRRIKSFISKYNFKNLKEFVNVLRQDESVLFTFKDYITINVTEFFRNAEKFEELRLKIIPGLISNAKGKGKSDLKIWSAGCSTGAEAYSTAIIMDAYFPGQNYSILATDIDVNIVKNAKIGEYKDIEVKNVNTKIMEKYFEVQGSKYKIKEFVKKNVKFTLNNLLEDQFSSGFDLIMCRNVVIYFTEEAKELLYKKFYNALTEKGVLFIGGTESILNAKQIGFSMNNNLFYYK